LPYVGNYGFIPSTYSDPTKRGDGDFSKDVKERSLLDMSDITAFFQAKLMRKKLKY
jgi:inorganic pyrophosphatase